MQLPAIEQVKCGWVRVGAMRASARCVASADHRQCRWAASTVRKSGHVIALMESDGIRIASPPPLGSGPLPLLLVLLFLSGGLKWLSSSSRLRAFPPQHSDWKALRISNLRLYKK